MTIILSAVYVTGWVGIGFSRDGRMVGSSAMVGWLTKRGHVRIKQYYLQGTDPSQVVPDQGELELQKVPPVVVLHGAMIYMAFQVRFQTRLARQPILLAFSSTYPRRTGYLSRHDDKTTILIDFSRASFSIVDTVSSRRRNHGILGIFAWGLILPLGAIFSRYMRHKDPLWYYLHAITQFLGFIIGFVTVLLGVRLYDKMKANAPAHRGIGIFVLVASNLQVLALVLRPSNLSKIRKYWNLYHHWLGRTALFFGSLNIVLGIILSNSGSSWKIGYGFLLTVILVVVIVLEILLRTRRSEKTVSSPPTFQMNPEHEEFSGSWSLASKSHDELLGSFY
ncbi:cytochrome b561 and DOMON domain-containing protein At3g61750 [Carica papaya]|uniref:cytochrome b561 and DOMON domain-containing protein At3g61750 n=1 Tax=Carica papaya TaxID=3649 RepID=UPI000B8C81DB|nr:cytochrome b561 and DOMON domain-containing protein At3g61750 [Carica papaya]